MSDDKPERVYSTADVRPIGDVVADLNKVIVGKLGHKKQDPYVLATWSAVCESAREYKFAEGEIEELKVLCGQDALTDTRLWLAHGRHQMCSRIIRAIADDLGVPNMKEEG